VTKQSSYTSSSWLSSDINNNNNNNNSTSSAAEVEQKNLEYHCSKEHCFLSYQELGKTYIIAVSLFGTRACKIFMKIYDLWALREPPLQMLHILENFESKSILIKNLN
jgi:hypothetical protein